MRAAPESSLHPINQARGQFIRPLGDGGWCHTDRIGGCADGTSQQINGFMFQHAASLVH